MEDKTKSEMAGRYAFICAGTESPSPGGRGRKSFMVVVWVLEPRKTSLTDSLRTGYLRTGAGDIELKK